MDNTVKTKMRIDNKPFVKHFVFAGLFLVAGVIIPDFVINYWTSKLSEIVLLFISSVFFTFAVKAYIKKDIKIPPQTMQVSVNKPKVKINNEK